VFGKTKLLHRTLVANGTKRHFAAPQQTVAFWGKADIAQNAQNDAFDPKRTSAKKICRDAKCPSQSANLIGCRAPD
jgi:hypothetical protein